MVLYLSNDFFTKLRRKNCLEAHVLTEQWTKNVERQLLLLRIVDD